MSYPYQAAPDPTAVVGRRVVATLVDGLVIAGPAIAVSVAELDLQYLEEENLQVPAEDFCDLLTGQSSTSVCLNVNDRVYFSDNTPVLGWLTGLVLGVALLVLLQGLKGLTPGKALLGIRTAGPDGRAPGIGKALVRWLLLVVDGFPWCAPLLGFILALSTKGHQRLGDKAGGTFVVSKAAFGQPLTIPGVATGAPAYPGGYGAPGQPGPGTGPGWGPPAGGAPASGDAWAPAAQPQPGTAGWGRDPASSDSWAAARPYGAPATAPAPTPSGERPAAPAGAASGPPSGGPASDRPAPPSGGLTSDRPAPPGWAPSTGETQAVPTAESPAPAAGAPAASPWGPSVSSPSPAPSSASASPAPPSADAGEHSVPFSPEPPRVAGATASSADPADPTGPAAGADRPAPPADATEVVPDPDAGPPEAEHPLDVSPPPAPADDPDATVVAGATATSAPSGADPDATVVSSAGPAPGGDPDATAVGQVPDADRTMISPTPVAAAPQAQYNPQWDAARGTYIVWEPGRGQWLGWDDNAREWRRL